MPSTWIVFTRPGYSELYRVTESSPSAQSDFTISAKTTRLELDAHEHLSWFNRRQTLVYIESEELPLGEEPIETEVSGDAVELATTVGELRRDHTILVSGRLAGAGEDDPPVVEAAVVTTVEDADGRSTLRLAASLVNAYQRDTVVVFANVAHATHGETVLEVLGSGDGARRNQSFTLKKPPLTYVSAATPSGSRSELEVRVDGVLWEEVSSLYGLDPTTQAYVVRIDDDANATVTFGDGGSGARLPTGSENVTSAYRSGIGPDGAVDEGSLTLLQTRPYGIRSVTNPVRASGAAAPEALEDARSNAPLTVLTLDRIVSLRDFEDFARSFAGIGKAQAVTLWDRKTRFVHLTVAAADGTALDPGGALEVNLRAGIDAARDAVADVAIDSFREVTFDVRARLLVDERYETEDVEAAVRAAVEDRFSFERRSFGQPVTRSEVIATMQGVEGVVAAMVDELHPTDDASLLVERIPAETAAVLDALARRAPRATVGAQLLLVNSAGLTLETTRP
jgi:predicted phage baseplate assembly protein